MSWTPGQHVHFRYIREARAFWTLPVTVVADEPDQNALWVAPGTPMLRPEEHVGIPALAARTWRAVEASWYGEGVLMLRRPHTRHAIWHFWTEDGAFRGWYVNLEDWWRTEAGMDAFDHQLDIWVHPDGSWEWKDEDDLAEAVAYGLYSPEKAEAIRAEGARVLDEWPFPTGWEDWRPDRRWSTPVL